MHTKRWFQLVIAEPSNPILAQMLDETVDRFDGYTMTKGEGAWRNSNQVVETEKVVNIGVSVDTSFYSDVNVVDWARRLATMASQEEVMLILPEGEVKFFAPYS